MDPMNLRLHSGDVVDLRTLSGNQIRISDIAHGLAHICRFAGQCREFYSVAEHSVLVYNLYLMKVLPETPSRAQKLSALLHDAAEAYLVDLPRNVKHSLELNGYRDIEADLERRIADQFGLVDDPRIKEADKQALEIERRDLFVGPQLLIHPCAPTEAKKRFRKAYDWIVKNG